MTTSSHPVPVNTKLTIAGHRSCPDGSAGIAWLVKNAGWDPEHLTIQRCSYDDNFDWALNHDYSNEIVMFVDFCPPVDVIRHIAATAAVFIILDHHQTAYGLVDEAGLARYDSVWDWEDADHPSPAAVIDRNHSGAMLAAHYVNATTGVACPEIIKYVEDRDLWNFQYPQTQPISTWITSQDHQKPGFWDWLWNADLAPIIREGKAIDRYRLQLIETTIEDRNVFWLDLDEETLIPCVTAPYMAGSDVAGALAEKHDGIGAYAIPGARNIQIGLRSRGDGPDVEQIAKRFGGGGHKHASGLRLDWDTFKTRVTGQPE